MAAGRPEATEGADGPTERSEPEAARQKGRPWVRPALLGIALLLVSGGIGFGIGVISASGEPDPISSEREAFLEARKEVRREMTRRGYVAGKRSGRSHGIIAGGMAAESDAIVSIREERAGKAQAEASAAQSELSGMTAAPTPPSSEAVEGDG